jgi:hypothetical protein
MQKLTAQDAETRSPDLVAENIEQLKALFPEAFTEGKVDFEVLKQLLGGAVDERDEKYASTGTASVVPASSRSHHPPAPCARARKTVWTGTPLAIS